MVAAASSRLVDDLHKKGIEISKEYRHVLSDSEIRHTLAHHGDERERLRGQIPITEEDFEKIPDIVENYDTVEYEGKERDNDVIRYSKAYDDGTVIYLEEVRNGRGELALKTFWKTKGSSKRLGANRTNATQIPSSDETSEGKGNKTSETTKENEENNEGELLYRPGDSEEVAERGNDEAVENHIIGTVLYGSPDLFNWYMVGQSATKEEEGGDQLTPGHIIDKMQGSPYKYFRVLVMCRLNASENIYGCSLLYELKDNNILR